MRARRSQQTAMVAAGLVLAGTAGVVLWFAIWTRAASSWNGPTDGRTYEEWNRLMVLPLLVLGATTAAAALRLAGWARISLAVAAAGFLLGLAGSFLEFWIAGGIRTGAGDRTLSNLGWTVFLIGHTLAAAGLIGAAMVTDPTRRTGATGRRK